MIKTVTIGHKQLDDMSIIDETFGKKMRKSEPFRKMKH